MQWATITHRKIVPCLALELLMAQGQPLIPPSK